ncbi:DNA/pantothenate metabolism flavoprotein [Nitrincola nitratireducens]|uniref:DNA/pantothenate metabolism flavoprotein n=2 Tax=Nitrincola TaxID=267849 RepID=W9UTN4_9GAMM|nr:DNA/pantothenate metabolism flavoprotein [Nitrincola nitratireducens]
MGRMLEPEALLQAIANQFDYDVLNGQRVVITAGPTREAIDPVRFISNHSSGKMGYALAEAAADAGAEVTLISGPVNLSAPAHVKRIMVESAQDMLDAALHSVENCDVFIGAAAVADYRPESVSTNKLKKGKEASMDIRLVKNPDIIATIAALPNKPFTIGFAAETNDVLSYAREKRLRKQLDMIIANDVSIAGIGFNSDENQVTLITSTDEISLPQTSKRQLARQLIEQIAPHLPTTR